MLASLIEKHPDAFHTAIHGPTRTAEASSRRGSTAAANTGSTPIGGATSAVTSDSRRSDRDGISDTDTVTEQSGATPVIPVHRPADEPLRDAPNYPKVKLTFKLTRSNGIVTRNTTRMRTEALSCDTCPHYTCTAKHHANV